MEKAPGGELIMLPCNLLEDHPLRLAYYSQAHLEGLYQSIKANGLLEPLLVWTREDSKYQILSGHYRVRAVRQLKQPVIACRLYTGDRHSALVIYCTANILTRSIGALEEALILHTLVKNEGYTMEGAGKLWGRSKSWVSRRIKLLTSLDPSIKEDLLKGGLKPRLAQDLAMLPRGNQQRVLAIIRREHLNKDEAARLIQWWQSAGGKDRILLEEGEILPGCGFDGEKRTESSYQLVLKSLKKCTSLINELIPLLKQGECQFPWPDAQYRIFLMTVNILKQFCPKGGDLKGAPGVSTKAGEKGF